MNYADFSKTIMPDLEKTIGLINNIEIDPEIRQLNLEILFRELGEEMYFVVYDMNAFDMDIWNTNGMGISNDYYRIAKEVSDSLVTGSPEKTKENVRAWVKDVIAKAQEDAFETAKDLSKYPTVTRSAVGKTCDWCRGLVGTHIDPTSEVFKRHAFCDCKIITSGYRSKNGELKNYVKLTREELSERQRFYGARGAARRWEK